MATIESILDPVVRKGTKINECYFKEKNQCDALGNISTNKQKLALREHPVVLPSSSAPCAGSCVWLSEWRRVCWTRGRTSPAASDSAIKTLPHAPCQTFSNPCVSSALLHLPWTSAQLGHNWILPGLPAWLNPGSHLCSAQLIPHIHSLTRNPHLNCFLHFGFTSSVKHLFLVSILSA